MVVDDETLGARVKRLREGRLTQEQLAEKAKMERTDISKLENDKLPLGPRRLARVAAALGVSVLELQPEAEPDELGQTLLDRQAELEADVIRLTREVRRLTRQCQALARRVPPESAAEESAGSQ